MSETTPPALPPTLPASPPPSPPQSLLARLLNIFATPGDVYGSIAGTEPDNANWLVPAMVFLLVSWVGAFLVFSQPAIQQQMRETMDKAIDQQMAKQHLSQAQADQARQMGEKIGGITQTIAAYAAPAFIAFVTPFLLGLIFWLIAQRAWKAQVSYMKIVEVMGLATMISALETVVRCLLILNTTKIWANLSPALLISDFDFTNPLHSLALLANPLIFWLLIVRAIGLARVCRVSTAKASAWMFGLWFVYTGLTWSMGALSQLINKKMGGH
jgi:hypothetical protein